MYSQNFIGDLDKTIKNGYVFVLQQELSLDEITDKILSSMDKIRKLNIERVGVFQDPVLNREDDIEIYAVCDPYDPSCNYYAFETLMESLFPGYVVGCYTREDIDRRYYENVMSDVIFCDEDDDFLF